MSRNVVKKLLRAVPSEDLKGLKSICVRTVPHKATKRRYRRWGGIWGQHGGCGDEGTSKVWIYLWGITQDVLKRWRYYNSNPYDSFTQEFASVLYHEVGHHVHSKTVEYKTLCTQIEALEAKMRRLERKRVKQVKLLVCPPDSYLYFLTDEYYEVKKECDFLRDKVEQFAKEYAENVLSRANEMGLLDTLKPTDIRFFKVMRDKYIATWFKIYEEFKKEGWRSGVWNKMLGLFDHLRKCKLGNGVKYNLREIFVKVYVDYPEKNELRRFKRFALKHAKPFYYVSRSGRKYGYFTEAQMNELRHRKDGFERTPPKSKPEPLIIHHVPEGQKLLEEFWQRQPLDQVQAEEAGLNLGTCRRGGGEVDG